MELQALKAKNDVSNTVVLDEENEYDDEDESEGNDEVDNLDEDL